MDSRRISVGEAVGEALAFWRASWRRAVVPLAGAALAALVAQTLPPDSPELAVAYLVYAVVGLMAQGALFRLAMRRAGVEIDEPGPGGLQWRALEWRLLAVGLLIAVVFLIVIFVSMFLIAVVAVGMIGPDAAKMATPQDMAAALSPSGRGVLVVLLALVLGFLVWLALRLSLAAPATAAEGRVRLFSTWRLTRGRVLLLGAAAVLIYLPLAVLGLLAALVDAAGGKAVGGWASIVSTAVGLFFYIPISVGLLSHLYLRLRERADEP